VATHSPDCRCSTRPEILDTLEGHSTLAIGPPTCRGVEQIGHGPAGWVGDDRSCVTAVALQPLQLLAGKNLVYWGDIDTHGFAILNRVRRSFEGTRSMLMDRATLLADEGQWVGEANPTSEHLEALLPDESSLYNDLVEGVLGSSVRLEQERISYAAIQEAARRYH
jgi:hypothetical protein